MHSRAGAALADEPTGNLDSKTGAEILDLLLGLREQHGMTIIIATHEHQVADRCQRLIRLYDGRIVEDTGAEEPAPRATRPGPVPP